MWTPSLVYNSTLILIAWGWVGHGHSSQLKPAEDGAKKGGPYNIIVSRSHAGDVEKVAKEALGAETTVIPAGGAGRLFVFFFLFFFFCVCVCVCFFFGGGAKKGGPYNIILSRSHAGNVEKMGKEALGSETTVIPAGGAGRLFVLFLCYFFHEKE